MSVSEKFKFYLPWSLSIFLGAFLVFQIQPMIARYILPWFGGSPSLWTTAMLFFQLMLLLGYAYAHAIVKFFPLKRQVIAHLVFLVLSALTLPVTPSEAFKPDGGAEPTFQILLLLAVTVGLPYVILSATAPLMQAWLTKMPNVKGAYGQYALSNIGSVSALASYPFLIEPHIGLNSQTHLWSVLFLLFIVTSAWVARRIFTGVRPPQNGIFTAAYDEPAKTQPIGIKDLSAWFSLSCLGVVILLSVTNQLCKNVAVIPLLWILPLMLYLFSFILVFGRSTLYRRGFWAGVLILSYAAVIVLVSRDHAADIPIFYHIVIYTAVVFSSCVICHGELYRLRPEPQSLTTFYLMMSFGGAAGGVFVAVAAPLLFSEYWEFHIGLVACMSLFGFFAIRDLSRRKTNTYALSFAGVWCLLILVAGITLFRHSRVRQKNTIYTERSFFGVLRVDEYGKGTEYHVREFYHGVTLHGFQYMNGGLRRRPVSYYSDDSGAALAVGLKRESLSLDQFGTSSIRVAVIGQGVSTFSAFGQQGDLIRFYELDPNVSMISDQFFTYQSDSPAKIEVIHGDGRISLENEWSKGVSQRYDVIAVDAFSGDGIPIHLLTKEALETYKRHLAKDGVLMFLISNHYFDLRPVLRGLGTQSGMHTLLIERSTEHIWETENDWVILTDDDYVHGRLKSRAAEWPLSDPQQVLWTDDFANLLQLRK